MEKYEAIIGLVNEKLKSDADTIRYYREKVAELEKKNAELVETCAELTKESNGLKLALMN